MKFSTQVISSKISEILVPPRQNKKKQINAFHSNIAKESQTKNGTLKYLVSQISRDRMGYRGRNAPLFRLWSI
jgi:hypothetical protein